MTDQGKMILRKLVIRKIWGQVRHKVNNQQELHKKNPIHKIPKSKVQKTKHQRKPAQKSTQNERNNIELIKKIT